MPLSPQAESALDRARLHFHAAGDLHDGGSHGNEIKCLGHAAVSLARAVCEQIAAGHGTDLAALTQTLRASSEALAQAVSGTTLKESHMPDPTNPTLDALAAQVAQTTSVEQSAVQALNGVAARIQAAVDAAIAGGATAAQLAPITDEVNQLQASSAALAAAVAANTPAAPATGS